MKTIQAFIDLGWYTVPLKGKLERQDDGKKTTPIFERDWKALHAQEFNENATALGGVLTGAINGIVAIDCDSSDTYNLFASLDKKNTFHFISKGKPSGGGTILYKYIDDIPSFSLQNDTIKLDYFSDNGFVYLPTDKNKTKEAWPQEEYKDLPPLHKMPEVVRTLLQTLHQQYTLAKVPKPEQRAQHTQLANYLAPSIELMLSKDVFSPTLFRIITPKDFRQLPQYVTHGYLHPDNVPDGRGSEYLSKVSAILGKDASVSKALYVKAMKFINGLWDTPLPLKRLLDTVITPMVEGRASVNGDPIWTYDEHWKTKGFSFINKLGEAVETFFDDVRSQYYLVNYTQNSLKTYYKDTDIFSYIDTVGLGLPAKKEFKNIIPLVRTINDPAKQFGFYSIDEYTRGFNTFNQTPQLAVLSDPATYAPLYKPPVTTLAFLKHLVPDDQTRAYLLKWLRKKLTTFSYSPVILYFLGAHGSGKDTFVTLLSNILGESYIAKPTTKEFLEQYNGWIVDKYFVQLDEYGNQLSRVTDKQEALGKIKAYSGKQNIQIRQMRTDGFQYKHNTTFIMTANTNPLLLEAGDRRAFIINTPHSMADLASWTDETDLGVVHTKLEQETQDFCYYLATEVQDLSMNEYMTPPTSKSKHSIIAQSLPAATRLAYYFTHKMFDTLEGLAAEYEVPHLMMHSADLRIYEDDLFELYSGMTDNMGVKRGLAMAMQEAGFAKIPTTQHGLKAYYFKVPLLKYYSSNLTFDEIEVDV